TNYNAVDFSVDFYKFLYNYYQQMGCLQYWPDWDNGDYITIEYINHTLAGDENGKPLYNGEYVDLSVAALGRSALNPQSSLTPRVPGVILKGDENGASEGGRAQLIDDGSFVFLNPSENENAVFKWYINRYVNVNELESLVFDADLEFGENATKQDIAMKMALLGENVTKQASGYEVEHKQRGFYASMDQMIQKYSNCENKNDIVKKYQNVTIDFHTVCKGYEHKGVGDSAYPADFMPDDNLVHVRDIVLTLPPKSKLTINNFAFNVENVYASASTPDTVYPWVSTESANAIPTYGTPVGSQHIDDGSYAKTQNWVVSDDYEAPGVYKKFSVIDLKKGTGTMTGFWRTVDGSTYMTCNTTSDSDFKTQTLSNGSVNINLSETPYLYYSYELDGDDAAVAFHFDFGSGESYSDCFLSGSGLSLDKCSGMMGSEYFKSYPNYVYKSMSSSASARTGVIDLAKLKSDYYDGSFMSGTVSLQSLNVYMTGKNAKLRVRYMFFGTKTIDVSQITEHDIIAVKAGDHFPWAVSPTSFDVVTLGGDSSDRCVYANRLDMLDDMIDRAKWAYRLIVGDRSAKVGTPEIGSIVDEDDYLDESNKNVIQNPQTPTFTYSHPDNGGDGSITVSAYQEEHFKFVGQFYNRKWYGGYDHYITFDVPSAEDLTSIRYLNYSVNAKPGMRWSIMINLQQGRETSSTINKTLVFSWNGTAVEIKETTECPGVKSYFDDNSCYAIPGSGTGCIDLWDHLYKGDVNAITSIRLVVYKDENEMKDVNGKNYADGSVTFNYLHLTSEALKPSSWGTMPMDPQNDDSVRSSSYVGKSYSWPIDTTTSIKTPTTNSDERTFSYPVYNADWSTDYYLNSSKTKFNFSYGQNYKTHYSLYYSYYLTKKDTGEMAYAPITMTIWQETQTTYSYRSRKTDIGEASVTRSDSFDEELKGCLRLQMPESGQILLDDLHLEGITFIRFHYDGAKYKLHVKELTVRIKSGQKTYTKINDKTYHDYRNTPYQSGNKVLTKLNSGLTVNFASKYADTRTINTPDSDYNDRIKVITGNNTSGDITPYYATNTKFINSKSLVVDLNKTPYLYYSLKCNNNATGTFTLHFNVGKDTNNAQHYFFRNGAVSIQTETSGYYLSLDQTPAVSQYLPTSENGCLDIRSWLLHEKLITEANPTITVKGVGFYVDGDGVNDSVLFNYMYFDGLSEKTVDLLPAKSHGMLENASNTRTWLFTSGNSSELSRDWDENAQWDEHDKKSQFQDDNGNNKLGRDTTSELITDVRHLPDGGAPDDDNLPDGYNDFRVRSNPEKVAAGEGNRWSWISVNYGALTGYSAYESGVKDDQGRSLDYHYVTTGNNQMSGLFVDLNDTPYLHFSISQSEDSYSSFLLQTNKYTPNGDLTGLSFVESLKPWLSNYNTKSAAGQLVHVPPQTYHIRSYKDYMQEDYNGTYQNGDYAGVIDLRSWFTETNGYGNIISLERIRFYTAGNLGTCSDFTVNHFYLSSSPASSYTVTFDNNIPEDPATSETEHLTRTVHVLKNANEQYVSDSVVESYKTREGYTFVGWYTDKDWENYYDISEKPVSENLTLYAGWIKKDDVVKGEVDLLRPTIENPSSVVETGGSTQQDQKDAFWHAEEDSLHITNNGVTDYTVSIPVNLPYSLLASRSLYIGFDTSTSMNTALGDPSNGNAVKIEYVLKSLGTHRYDVLGEAFGEYYTGNTNGILSAGPYDKQLPIYSYLSENNLRPDLIKENQEHGYVVAKSIDFTVPAGCSIHVRYATAAKAMGSTSLEVVAPEITSSDRVSGTNHEYSTGIIDLLDPRDDMGYIEQLNKVTYSCPESMTSIYNREELTPSELHQATLNSASLGYVSLGGQ
ncbi:MAG: InlB B-repeat-containing protein, partial [Parabacteroides sp.]|nr:InlB B-repeat-containing protein [Parabacteroides sp.]